jgi:2-dehydro-3-deoxygluconokinase
MHSTHFIALGEIMIEMCPQAPGQFAMNFAGDTYNVAYYIAQYQHNINAEVHYATALGEDHYSQQMQKRMQQHGVDTDYVLTLPGETPGLYLIDIDAQGERQFVYYRQHAAARKFWQAAECAALKANMMHADYLYFSGISLAILDSHSQADFFHLLQQARANGCKICFDTNYRAALWPDKNHAQQVITQFLSCVDIALPTFSDEQQLFADATPQATLQRLQHNGVPEIIVKNGAQGCYLFSEQQTTHVASLPVAKVTDTTCAGDAFNAAYLAARIAGLPPTTAAGCGHQLAATVIQHRGALIQDKNTLPKLFIDLKQNALEHNR